MNKQEKRESDLQRAVAWCEKLTDEQQAKVFRDLLEFAMDAEWVSMWSEKDIEELAEESGCPVEEYQAPYYRTCGEPLIKTLYHIIYIAPKVSGYSRQEYPAVELLEVIGGGQMDRTCVVSTDHAKLERIVEKLVMTSASDESYEIRIKPPIN